MSAVYIRRCPTCGAEEAQDAMRCQCGALLASVDPVLKEAYATEASAEPKPVHSGESPKEMLLEPIRCPFPDCAQPNTPGSETCVYCDRPLKDSAMTPQAEMYCLMNLPSKLKQRFQIVRPLPAGGAEAELLLVEPHDGGPIMVAKIYRHGMQPDRDVLVRILKIAPEHRVKMFDADISDGYAYELMEYCTLGSWRNYMQRGPLSLELLTMLVRELAIAIAGVHEAGLVHRDLKPENILIRSENPWDLVLTDFGISSIINATQCFTSTARTLSYASPESISGVLDGKADYWSLGMIVLECALGRHPFSGLSEAVVLHHLTTRNIDLSGVADADLRKLLRGLLLRDPKERWGKEEVGRWLAGDTSLPDPIEHDSMGGFVRPYRVGGQICHTAGQLAVAFTQNWNEGTADIANGQLLAWFRDVQNDQNVVRLLIELRQQRSLSVDVQLLRLILQFAPGIPPVWRGEPLTTQSILAHANLALQGNSEAAGWLDGIYQLRILELYAAAGNAEAENLVQKWSQAGRRFDSACDEIIAAMKHHAPQHHPDDHADVDAMLYGNADIERPPLYNRHARLLALAFDAKWTERMRQRLSAELAGLLAYCPRLTVIGDPQTMEPASLLAVDALLPEIKKKSESQAKAAEREREAAVSDRKRIKDEIASVLSSLRRLTRNRNATRFVCIEINRLISEYHALLASARSDNHANTEWQEMIRSTARHRKILDQMQLLIDELTERRAANSGWLGTRAMEAAGAVILALLFFSLFRFRSGILLIAVLGIVLGVLAWRLLPNWSLMKQIRELGERL